MKDMTVPEIVEITVRDDGKVVWVNVDGECVLRCSQIKNLRIEDNQKNTVREITRTSLLEMLIDKLRKFSPKLLPMKNRKI